MTSKNDDEYNAYLIMAGYATVLHAQEEDF